MDIHILTLFPEMFQGPFRESIVGRAVESGVVRIRTHNIRDYAHDRHRTTDDYPFGGGGGMVLKPEPLFLGVEGVRMGIADEGSAIGEPKTPRLSSSRHRERYSPRE